MSKHGKLIFHSAIEYFKLMFPRHIIGSPRQTLHCCSLLRSNARRTPHQRLFPPQSWLWCRSWCCSVPEYPARVSLPPP
jgi:hypothetical protein